ncbi:MAG TPA: hypothetical protein PLI95_24285 [Polyangiaceae bacterium]|nr:hypothetical protein [Polyangiaceae bacterium]
MSDERKPTEDLKEGLSLIFRAAKTAAKQVDVNKIDKELDKAFTQAGRLATRVGHAVSEGINTVASKPPWQRGDKPSTGEATPGEAQGKAPSEPAPQPEAKPAASAADAPEDKKPSDT